MIEVDRAMDLTSGLRTELARLEDGFPGILRPPVRC